MVKNSHGSVTKTGRRPPGDRPSVVSGAPSVQPTRSAKAPLAVPKIDEDVLAAPKQPFRFFDLPSELRLRIYEEVLFVSKPIDLDPVNYRLILPRLTLLLVNRRMHDEAHRVFYSQSIQLFPTHGRFFHTKKPLLARLPTRYRIVINTIDLRLGPGWSAPPKCQNVGPTLGLEECTSVRKLKVFVECDPSDNVFSGFRGKNATEDTYKWFCVDLLAGILQQVPSVETVEVDAYPSVKKDAPLIVALTRVIEQSSKKLAWGPLRGWNERADALGMIGLESAMAGMEISRSTMLVEVQT